MKIIGMRNIIKGIAAGAMIAGGFSLIYDAAYDIGKRHTIDMICRNYKKETEVLSEKLKRES